MIAIAGGTYFEFCTEPPWRQLYGSGLRAAAALAALSDSVTLHTYVADGDVDQLRVTAETYHISAEPSAIQQTLAFQYFHGLSAPYINPPISKITRAAPLLLTAERVVRFGMLEGDAKVEGQWVVYDPQDALNPEPFAKNGSHAEHLAIVANYREAAMLTGHEDLTAIGHALRDVHGAEVVVIKRGALGATVLTSTALKTIPAFETPYVWPLGSGDVFAAVFAHFWAEHHLDPAEAAYRASLATAYYCSTRSLPIPPGLFEAPPFQPLAIQLNAEQELPARPQVYLAGPFFTMAQRWLIEEAREALAHAYLKVFSPLHDVGRGPASKVVQADIDGINASNVIFAIVDGLDAGTIFEIGYARAQGIPVVAFVQNENSEAVKMLEGTDCLLVDDFATAIYHAAWRALTR